MLNNSILKIILKEIERNNLFESFLSSIIFYKKKELLNFIIRYKIDNNFIIDIFDNRSVNTFIRYKFINEDNEYYIDECLFNNVIVNNIYIKKCYKEKYNSNNRIVLFASLYIEKDKNEIKKVLNKLFVPKIKDIFLKYLL